MNRSRSASYNLATSLSRAATRTWFPVGVATLVALATGCGSSADKGSANTGGRPGFGGSTVTATGGTSVSGTGGSVTATGGTSVSGTGGSVTATGGSSIARTGGSSAATGGGGGSPTGGARTGGATSATGGTGATAGSTGSSNTTGCPDELVGMAAATAYEMTTTTGGGNVTPQRVSTAAELASLAGDATPRVIEITGSFDVGTLNIKSNKTLVGIGRDVTLSGGVEIVGAGASDMVSNVIVRNLNIKGRGASGSPADAFAIRFAHHVWVDHCHIWDSPDGNLDITRGADYITVSWSKFWYTTSHSHRLSSLVGGGGGHGDTDTGKLHVTFHHNWWAEKVLQRMPRVYFGKAHVFNNYYSSSGNDYCIRAGANAGVLIENNYFVGVQNPHEFAGTSASITAKGNVYVNTTGTQSVGGSGTAFTEPPYPYTADAAADVPTKVQACVGPR